MYATKTKRLRKLIHRSTKNTQIYSYISSHQPAVNDRRSVSPIREDSCPSSTHPIQNESLCIPKFIAPSIPSYRVNQEIDNSHIVSFTTMYEKHCREICDMISSYQVERVRTIMHSFYQGMPPTFKKLVHNTPELIDAIWRWDSSLYDVRLLSVIRRMCILRPC